MPAMIADLNMGRTDGPTPQGGVDADPLAFDPDFRPHVEAHFGSLTAAIDVHQTERGARGNAGGPAHGGGKHGVLSAITVQALCDLGCSAESCPAVAAHLVVDPALDGLCLLPRVCCAADGFIGALFHFFVVAI